MVNKTLDECKTFAGTISIASGNTVNIGGRTVEFYKEQTITKDYSISNNDSGEKHIAFHLSQLSDVVIDGGGAELVFHGELLPFVIDNCKNVTLKNFSIDYPRPFYSQASIEYSCPEYTDLRFSDEFEAKVCDGELLFYSSADKWCSKTENRILVTEFEGKTAKPRQDIGEYLARFKPAKEASFLDGMTLNLRAEQRGDIIRLYGTPVHKKGNMWVCTHADRNAPGIFITESENVKIENVRLYHTASMGVIAQLSKDITLDNVNASPRDGNGRFLSVAADATHFVNCSGLVHMKNCKFVNMLDDACNIHGIYTVVKSENINNVTVEFCHFQQYGVPLYKPGDKIAFTDRTTMQRHAYATVEKATFDTSRRIKLTLCISEGEIMVNDAVENFTAMPRVLIENCESGDNRPRGFLISTPYKAVVRGCLFYNMRHGIHITGDANDWFESGPVSDVTISGNTFSDSAFCGGAAIQIDPRVPAGDGIVYHRGVKITDNTFIGRTKRFLYSRNCADLVFENNRFIYDEKLSPAPAVGSDGTDVKVL